MSAAVTDDELVGAARRAPARLQWTGIPAPTDPRIPFAVILTLYAAMGTLWLGFNRTPLQVLLTVATGCTLDMLLHLILRKRELLFPLSAYITSLSLALLLNYSHDYFLLAFPVFLAIGSKYLITFKGSHVFNPSLFGIVATLVLSGGMITAAPAYQWGGTWAMSAFMVTAALSLFIFRVGRGWLVGSFLFFYMLQTALRAYVMRAHLPPEMLFLGTLSTPPFFLFTFFMITDPKTSPSSRRGQIGLAAAITLVDLYWHTRQSVFTFFYAAFVVASARFVWLHGRALVAEGPTVYLRRALLSRRRLKTAAVLGALALGGGTVYATTIRPHVVLDSAGYFLDEVAAEASGIDIPLDPSALSLVDPRLQHISKWLLSVGSSVSVADVDRDGRRDLFFTTPLARSDFRTALYLNRGKFRFERFSIRALDPLSGDPALVGLPSGAQFFDYDSDGDDDLLVLVSFGETRLLQNLLVERGRLDFRDVTEEAGLDAYTIAVGANVLDYDRDSHPDVLIGNVLSPYLRDYEEPTRLNIFDLPDPAYDGDRRMFHFMHDGWHNATNGGLNILLHNRGDGTFEQIDAATMGMPETHWTLAVGTGDLNSDGWTDLYLASDFGRDDLYVNDHGRGFRRIAGRLFGDVGKDTYKGMNSSIADFDRNGKLDIYVSNVHHVLQAEGSMLWMNSGTDDDGAPVLRDEATSKGALNEDRFGWGAGIGDLDNNGWPDIVQANGMVDDRLDNRYAECPDYFYVNHKLMQSGPEIHTYADQWGDLRGRCIFGSEKLRVYFNRGAGARPQFVDVAELAGLTAGDNSRGVAIVDLDDDGHLDVVIANQHAGPTVLRNRPGTAAKASWIGLDLTGDGVSCGVGAHGSTVTVKMPGAPDQVREVQAANGFSAQHDDRIHVGLGGWNGREVSLVIRWCNTTERTYRLAPDRYHPIKM